MQEVPALTDDARIFVNPGTAGRVSAWTVRCDRCQVFVTATRRKKAAQEAAMHHAGTIHKGKATVAVRKPAGKSR